MGLQGTTFFNEGGQRYPKMKENIQELESKEDILPSEVLNQLDLVFQQHIKNILGGYDADSIGDMSEIEIVEKGLEQSGTLLKTEKGQENNVHISGGERFIESFLG